MEPRKFIECSVGYTAEVDPKDADIRRARELALKLFPLGLELRDLVPRVASLVPKMMTIEVHQLIADARAEEADRLLAEAHAQLAVPDEGSDG